MATRILPHQALGIGLAGVLAALSLGPSMNMLPRLGQHLPSLTTQAPSRCSKSFLLGNTLVGHTIDYRAGSQRVLIYPDSAHKSRIMEYHGPYGYDASVIPMITFYGRDKSRTIGYAGLQGDADLEPFFKKAQAVIEHSPCR